MRVSSDLTSGFRMGIEVDFDGPDGGVVLDVQKFRLIRR
jgi:hypothetical protein